MVRSIKDYRCCISEYYFSKLSSLVVCDSTSDTLSSHNNITSSFFGFGKKKIHL